MSKHELMRLAAKLGSDVPFLASDAVMAMAWARGDRMLALPPLPRRDVLLLTPAFSISTADAYRWIDDDRRPTRESGDAVVFDPIDLSTWNELAKFARNDFETVVSARHPQLSEHIAQLRSSQPALVGMTGSGSTVFAVLDSPGGHAPIPVERQTRVTTTRTSIDVVPPERVG